MSTNYKLTVEQQKLVIEHIKLPEIVVRSKFITKNKYITDSYLAEDAIQDAFVALCKAACSYEDGNGSSFVSYATFVIFSYIKDKIRVIDKNRNSMLQHKRAVIVPIDDTFDDTIALSVYDEITSRVEYSELVSVILKRKAVYEKKEPLGYELLLRTLDTGKSLKSVCESMNIVYQTPLYYSARRKYINALTDLRNILLKAGYAPSNVTVTESKKLVSEAA